MQRSHPVWVCGLKLIYPFGTAKVDRVTPCMGVWIETPECPKLPGWKPVTPCMGVWIETQEKSVTLLHKLVTPCMGVWIETPE